MAGNFPRNRIIFILIIFHPVMTSLLSRAKFSLGWEWFCLQDHIPEYLNGKCVQSNNNRSVLLRFTTSMQESGIEF